MSFKVLQFSPQASTRGIGMRAIPETWSGPGDARDIGFLRLWLEYESEFEPRHINWGAVSGLALSLAVSAGFWTAVVMIVERLLR